MNHPAAGGPRHVAIIMDGNGRWARSRGLPRMEGHRQGVENVKEVLRAAKAAQVEHLTLFAFSVENWSRPPEEIKALMKLLEFFLKRNLNVLIKNEVRLHIIGRSEELPERVQPYLKKALQATAHFDQYHLHVGLNYGSRTEVVDAVKAYAKDVAAGKEDPEALDWEQFSRRLYTAGVPDPDLLIRTSGESRISNFLLLQCAYSELYFSPVHWPDFSQQHFFEAIEAFRKRERRFGKTGEQIRNQSHPSAQLEPVK